MIDMVKHKKGPAKVNTFAYTLLILAVLSTSCSKNGKVQTVKIQERPKVDFGKIQINVTCPTRYIQFDVILELENSDILKYFDDMTTENPRGMKKRIRATIISVIGDKNFKSLSNPEYRIHVKKEIKDEINKLLINKNEGLVTKVYLNNVFIRE